jgi:hypothetical protein
VGLFVALCRSGRRNQRWTVDRGDRKPSVDIFLAGLHHRGRVEREIYLHWLDASSPLTSAEARQVARALMAAADACERAADEIDNGTGTVAP